MMDASIESRESEIALHYALYGIQIADLLPAERLELLKCLSKKLTSGWGSANPPGFQPLRQRIQDETTRASLRRLGDPKVYCLCVHAGRRYRSDAMWWCRSLLLTDEGQFLMEVKVSPDDGHSGDTRYIITRATEDQLLRSVTDLARFLQMVHGMRKELEDRQRDLRWQLDSIEARLRFFARLG